MRILKAKEPAARQVPDAVTEDTGESVQEQQRQEPGNGAGGTGFTDALVNHKGKLAVGAAAMLGLAVFYKWRESKLARDDPEEYARLRRLKAAVDTDEGERGTR